MADLKHVTYCGLYCKLCANLARIPQQAKALRDTFGKTGWPDYGEAYVPEFKAFWKGLEHFSKLDEICPGCRGGCGFPECPIRACAVERGLEVCSACADFPCHHLQRLGRRYPTLLADAERQRCVGMAQWIEEQEERVSASVCYMDFRYRIEDDDALDEKG